MELARDARVLNVRGKVIVAWAQHICACSHGAIHLDNDACRAWAAHADGPPEDLIREAVFPRNAEECTTLLNAFRDKRYGVDMKDLHEVDTGDGPLTHSLPTSYELDVCSRVQLHMSDVLAKHTCGPEGAESSETDDEPAGEDIGETTLLDMNARTSNLFEPNKIK